jgi:hypothetical protein
VSVQDVAVGARSATTANVVHALPRQRSTDTDVASAEVLVQASVI